MLRHSEALRWVKRQHFKVKFWICGPITVWYITRLVRMSQQFFAFMYLQQNGNVIKHTDSLYLQQGNISVHPTKTKRKFRPSQCAVTTNNAYPFYINILLFSHCRSSSAIDVTLSVSLITKPWFTTTLDQDYNICLSQSHGLYTPVSAYSRVLAEKLNLGAWRCLRRGEAG